MKLFTFIIAASLAFLSACGGPAANTGNTTNNANAGNATAAKPAAPTKEAFIEMEKKAYEAFTKGDTAHFDKMLSDKFVGYNGGKRYGKADEMKMIGSVKCEAKSWSHEDAQMAKINDDTYVMVYKSNFDGTCTMDGKTEKVPSPTRAATIWVRDGSDWKAAFHSETPIIDPKNPPAAPPAASGEKKEEASADAAKPAAGPNTEALKKMHQGGWDAWKAKDAKWFNDNMAATASFVDPMGTYVATKADAIKVWTETMKCEGVTKAEITDAVATAISPTVEILTLKGAADGSCDGQKNGPLYQSAVYVKEGDAWKLAFMFESPAM